MKFQWKNSAKLLSFVSIFAVLVVSFASCKKESSSASVDIPVSKVKSNVPIPPFDWEGVDKDFMPMPANTFTVLVPWGSGASRQITDEMLFDYKSADGWRLVYNTFSRTSLPTNYYFVLYNIYRGLYRMYYFVPPSSNFITSKNIVHTLSLKGSYAPSSPMLNFSGQDLIDYNTKAQFASMIEQYQVAPGTWYAFQWEVAYDRDMSAQNYQVFSWDWNIRSSQLTNISMNGTQTGAITGNINTPGQNFTAIGSLNFNIDASKKSNITVNGTSDANKHQSTLGPTIVNIIKGAITSGVQGVIKNVLNGIFQRKPTSTSPENVTLKVNSSISLSGALTSDFLITNPGFAISGYNQSTTEGYMPNYNSPLGVFYIDNKPIVTKSTTRSNVSNEWGDYIRYENLYSLNTTSFNIYYNPAVINTNPDGAQIANVTKEVVLINPTMVDFPETVSFGGVQETVGIYTVYSGTNVGTTYTVARVNPFNGTDVNIVGVRISFDVVPNNGAQPVRLSKTFLATLQ